MKRILLATLVAGSISALAQATSPAIDAVVAQCKALENVDFSGVQDAPTQLTGAKLMGSAAGVPAYCHVEGYITPQLDIDVRLPTSNWNSKFLATSNVLSGDACDTYLKHGYACITIFRNGKKGMQDRERFATSNNLQAQVDRSYRSTHLLTLAGKAIVERYYSKAPERSYYMGCSGGGYGAMVEAQAFPWDFDGIVAGAPYFDATDWQLRAAWRARNLLDKSGQPILNDNDIQILHRAVLAKCDKDDGLDDGIIGNPVGCVFDPSELTCKAGKKGRCLALSQSEAVKLIYAGPMTSVGVQTSPPGVLPGSELNWNAGFFSRDYLDLLFKDTVYGASPMLKVMEFDFDRDYKRLGLGALFAHANPDLRKFKSAGGKLLAHQGGNDPTLVAGGIVDYYEITERAMGGRAATQDFFRLFVLPGVDHCGGGVGAYAIDYLSYLEAWVEHSKAPDVMIGAHIKDAYLAAQPIKWPEGEKPPNALTPEMKISIAAHNLDFPLDPRIPIAFTRPAYPYPLYAKYKGAGDHNDAANFGPVDPQSTSRGDR